MGSRFYCLLFLLFCSSNFALRPSDSLSFGVGMFDMMRARWRTWEFEAEYKFHFNCLKSPNRYLEFRPLVGVMATAQGCGYLYAGLNFDLLFADHLLFAPGFAAGYYWKGNWKDLGFPLEFRSGIEVAWQFSDGRRLGFHFYHLSNASLGHRNPGEESLSLFYDIPINSLIFNKK